MVLNLGQENILYVLLLHIYISFFLSMQRTLNMCRINPIVDIKYMYIIIYIYGTPPPNILDFKT